MGQLLIWIIAAGTILGILVRPKEWPEAVWAVLGAVLLVLCGLVPPREALTAVGRGTDVYLFLTGMMVLAELARREGVFDWLAALAVRAARGSRARLFALVYGVGILVTAFLSNDATAVVLTPAVFAAVQKARAEPLPYLYICAFIANAASFLLPISNPANLVVFGEHMPPLLTWLRIFALPSLLSIAATYGVLRWTSRRELMGEMESDVPPCPLSPAGRNAAYGILGTGAVLLAASALGRDLGLPTCAAALAAGVVVAYTDRGAPLAIARDVSWSVLPLVAGLFVLVEGINRAGALPAARAGLDSLHSWTPLAASVTAAFGFSALCNLMNNLPVGLLTGSAVQSGHVSPLLRHALLIGVDVGPNLSVTGSLATVLWLVALRREKQQVGGWQFLKVGALVMPPALAVAILGLWLVSR